MTVRRSRRLAPAAGAVVAGAAAVLVGLSAAGPASADSPSPTLAAAASESDGGTVEDLSLPVEDLEFGEGTADGSLVGLGDRQFRIDADVLFAFDKADLSPKAAGLIAQVVAGVERSGATRLTVSGHTDDKGDDSYNRGLSLRRAQTVRAALSAALGSEVTITAQGYGETRPIAENRSDVGRALNRRVEIVAG